MAVLQEEKLEQESLQLSLIPFWVTRFEQKKEAMKNETVCKSSSEGHRDPLRLPS